MKLAPIAVREAHEETSAPDDVSKSDVAEAEATEAEAMQRLLREIRARRAEFGEQQHLSHDVVDLLREAGIYRALVAKQFGGDEKTPAEFLQMIEQIAEADGSTGWVASFGFSALYLSALPIETLEKIYANGPDVVFAGGIFPPQPAKKVSGGREVSGQWSWGSGCMGADLIGAGVRFEDGGDASGLPYMAVMPREAASIKPNWDVNGLKGTGSHDIVIDKAIVPDDWIFVRGGPSSIDAPLYRYPIMALAAQVLAVVALGCGRAALNELADRAATRKSITGAPVFAQRAFVQSGIAKAEAQLRSAKAFFYETVNDAFDTIRGGGALSDQQTILLRLSATNAAHTGSDVCRQIYTLSGTDGIFTSDPIAQSMQDAMVVPQHAFLSEGTWQQAGAAMFGLETPPGYP